MHCSRACAACSRCTIASIADAAHQLRTPLAGLSLHVDRARWPIHAPKRWPTRCSHIHRLTQRAARTSSQLLALTRAQASPVDTMDNALLEPDPADSRSGARCACTKRSAPASTWVTRRPARQQQLYIDGDVASLQDLLDNLIDNAIRYAGRGSTVTVSLRGQPDGGSRLSVEDDGPRRTAGVAAAPERALLPRTGQQRGRQRSGAGPSFSVLRNDTMPKWSTGWATSAA